MMLEDEILDDPGTPGHGGGLDPATDPATATAAAGPLSSSCGGDAADPGTPGHGGGLGEGRTYHRYRPDQRKRVATWHIENVRMNRGTLEATSRHFEQEFGRKIPTSTIHDWVKKEQGGARRSMERPRRSRRRSMKKKGIRSYHRYNDEQRNEVVRWHLENERKNRGTLEATSRHFEQEFGRKIPTSTIHDWVNKAKRK